MSVLDSSVAIDLLMGDTALAQRFEAVIRADGQAAAAPDILVFEVLAVLRRDVRRGITDPARAAAAVEDLGNLPLSLHASLALRGRAWELRDNLTAADGLFVALAEQVGEPLLTRDRGLARAARRHAAIDVIEL